MTAIDAMPQPALACVRLLDCSVCDYPRYVPTTWPADVCIECVGNPAHREQLERIYAAALAKANAAEAAWTTAREQAPKEACAAWHEVYALRQGIDSGAIDKATFLDYWKAAQHVVGLAPLYHAWQHRQATVNACVSTLNVVQPKLDALLAALTTLEHTQ